MQFHSYLKTNTEAMRILKSGLEAARMNAALKANLENSFCEVVREPAKFFNPLLQYAEKEITPGLRVALNEITVAKRKHYTKAVEEALTLHGTAAPATAATDATEEATEGAVIADILSVFGSVESALFLHGVWEFEADQRKKLSEHADKFFQKAQLGDSDKIAEDQDWSLELEKGTHLRVTHTSGHCAWREPFSHSLMHAVTAVWRAAPFRVFQAPMASTPRPESARMLSPAGGRVPTVEEILRKERHRASVEYGYIMADKIHEMNGSSVLGGMRPFI
jgi:hypothetical protein